MKNIHVLDCTLRDGGRIINCAFPDEEIKKIADSLADAKIDVVEVGFLRDSDKVKYDGNSTFFTEVDQIKPFIDKSKKNTMFVAFIDYELFDFDKLTPHDGTSIDGIRVGFTKNSFLSYKDDIIKSLKSVKQKGYTLFIQGVNSLSYSDKELLELLDLINEVHPKSFGIVDTYGAMYEEDVERIYKLVDHDLDNEIWIDFHSHNNFQLSFAFAQEIIKLSKGERNILIDATLNGMGKCAGNLCTELIVDYLVRKLNYDYEFDGILDVIDDYIYKYKESNPWGYTIPAFMAGIYQSHPNNVIYLTEKYRMDTKDIKNIMSMIEPAKRQRYDYDNIQKLYVEYAAEKVDDKDTINDLKKIIGEKEIVVLVPGASLKTKEKEIDDYIKTHNCIVISVNFVSKYKNAFSFWGNAKKYHDAVFSSDDKVIITSNIENSRSNDYIVDYNGLINRGYKYFENSSIMLFNLLKKITVKKVSIAGFDGFSSDIQNNYYDEKSLNHSRSEEFDELNKEIKTMFGKFAETVKGKCIISFITPSRFESAVKK